MPVKTQAAEVPLESNLLYKCCFCKKTNDEEVAHTSSTRDGAVILLTDTHSHPQQSSLSARILSFHSCFLFYCENTPLLLLRTASFPAPVCFCPPSVEAAPPWSHLCLTTTPSRVYFLLNSPPFSASSSLCLSVKHSSSLLTSPHVFLDFVWGFLPVLLTSTFASPVGLFACVG